MKCASDRASSPIRSACLLDPPNDRICNLRVVRLQHHHMAVAVDAVLGKSQPVGLGAGLFQERAGAIVHGGAEATLRASARECDIHPDPRLMALPVRTIDKHSEAVDFLLTANRDLDAAKRFFRKMLAAGPLLAPDRIGTDGVGPHPTAIAESRNEGLLPRVPVHYLTKHLQQGIESDRFRAKGATPREAVSNPFKRSGARSLASRPCCGCARASGLPVLGQSGSRTTSWPTASDFPRRTKQESGGSRGPSAARADICHKRRLDLILLGMRYGPSSLSKDLIFNY